MTELTTSTINEGHHVFTVSYDRRMIFIYTGGGVSASGIHPPESLQYDELVAYWDTGAKMTTVKHSIIQLLGLEKIRDMKVNCIAGTVSRGIYVVDIYLPGGLIIPSVEVMEGEISRGDMLIGMDIISLGDFAISNLGGKTTFTFRIPSEKVLDFCKPTE